MSTVALSQTLRSITAFKIQELDKQRKAYELHKNSVLDQAARAGDDRYRRLRRLIWGVEELESAPSPAVDLSNIRRWLDQSEFDASIPDTMLSDFEQQLRSQLDIQTRKLDLANLYSRLLTEWLNPSNNEVEETVLPDDSSLDGPFEVVEKDRLKQLKDKFEEVVFTPLETDDIDIDSYLSSLFQGEKGEKAVERLRREVKEKAEFILENEAPFEEHTLQWCLKGLLGNDLLSDEKKAILQDFLKDEVARGEICDVLNMKHADFSNWEWDAGDAGIPVQPRRQLNGKYRIMMDEDVLQAIFLHYIGTTWSVALKRTLGELIRYTSIWKDNVRIARDVDDRRRYFLGELRAETNFSVEKDRQEVYRQDFFLSQLPSSVHEGGDYEDEDRKMPDKKSPKEVKQQLLRQLATEAHLRLALEGQVAVVQSDLKWFATGISHSTIRAVLGFAGMPEEWIRFFTKFLEAPLNMGPVSDDPAADRVRIRKRGVPMSHVLEKFFGEFVLFFMDLAVNREAEMLLYRFHDDLWLCGEPSKCATAWESMKQHAAIMGFEFNRLKTGSVHITKGKVEKDPTLTLPHGPVSVGFLVLDPNSGDWVINQSEVDKHVKQLQKQLGGCKSILSWVQTWNSCIGRFFSHTFGEPANCFGKVHVNRILETYKRMQDVIFNGSDVTSYLKNTITERFGVTDIPDAFIFMPEELGGLGVRNPFIPLFLVRNQVLEDPASLLRKFLTNQEQDYEEAKKEFEELDEQSRRRRLQEIYVYEFGTETAKNIIHSKNLETFMTFDEFRRWDESVSEGMARTYQYLMELPTKKEIVMSRKVKDAVDKISISMTLPQTSMPILDSEMKWLLQLHSEELFEKCGGLSIVRKDLLPLGILTILRKRKVPWQMVL